MKKPALFLFKELYKDASPTIQSYIMRLDKTPQTPYWHPEGSVGVHTRIVFNRARKYNDLDLSLVALYHDLGKVDTTKSNGRGGYSAHEHEKTSAKLVKYTRNWILQLGGNPDKIQWLVENHMRVKYLDEMKPNKKNELTNHDWFSDLVIFREFDSKDNITVWEVILAGGNPFKFLMNKFKM